MYSEMTHVYKKKRMNVPFLLVTIMGGLLVLLSYWLSLSVGVSYTEHPLWLGQSGERIQLFIGLQLLAVLGFLLFTVSWIQTPPQTGIMSYNWILVMTMLIFMLGSSVWGPSAMYTLRTGSKWSALITVGVLIIVAVSSILFIAGAVEDVTGKWHVIFGTLLLAMTTVLCDGVAWNAVFLQRQLYDQK